VLTTMLTTAQTLEKMVSQLGSIRVADDEVNPALHHVLSPPATSLRSLSCGSLAFPCLLLSEPPLYRTNCRRFNTTSIMADLLVSREMSQSITFKSYDVDRVPQLILNNCVSTFITIIQRRRQSVVQNSVNFLGSDTDPGWNNSARLATLKVLSTPTIFKLVSATTESRLLARNRGVTQESTGFRGTSERQVTLPIIFSLKVTMIVLNKKQVNVIVKAKGIIKVGFVPNETINAEQHVEFELDTPALYKSMKDKAVALVELADSISDRQHHFAPAAEKLERTVPVPKAQNGVYAKTRNKERFTSSLAPSGIAVSSEAHPFLRRSARCA
jgi:hypothetical protein